MVESKLNFTIEDCKLTSMANIIFIAEKAARDAQDAADLWNSFLVKETHPTNLNIKFQLTPTLKTKTAHPVKVQEILNAIKIDVTACQKAVFQHWSNYHELNVNTFNEDVNRTITKQVTIIKDIAREFFKLTARKSIPLDKLDLIKNLDFTDNCFLKDFGADVNVSNTYIINNYNTLIAKLEAKVKLHWSELCSKQATDTIYSKINIKEKTIATALSMDLEESIPMQLQIQQLISNEINKVNMSNPKNKTVKDQSKKSPILDKTTGQQRKRERETNQREEAKTKSKKKQKNSNPNPTTKPTTKPTTTPQPSKGVSKSHNKTGTSSTSNVKEQVNHQQKKHRSRNRRKKKQT